MDSLTFKPGSAFLSSDSHTVPWTVVFEDEGVAGYFYACDRSHERMEDSILDAVLIYNVSHLGDRERNYLASVQWSKSGTQAVLYLDGNAQAVFDFDSRCGYCRTDFPNFLDERGSNWRKDSHAWSDEVLTQFEAEIYG
ncbi:MAG: DUF2251 domain-containing protein [Acidobacteriaceae bacterium]